MLSDFRPTTFDEIVGQKEVVEELKLIIESSKITGNPPGHILLLGPQGSGKSTLAKVFCNTLGTNMKSVSAGNMDDWSKLLRTILELQDGDVLFMDEMHTISNETQESLYIPMEDFIADIYNGRGKDARAATIQLPRFTLIGATTHAGNLNLPLLRRFDHQPQLTPYTINELTEMVNKATNRMYEEECPKYIAHRIAQLSRTNASTAYSLLKNYKEIAVVLEKQLSPSEILDKTIKLKKLDPWLGLDYSSRQYINALVANDYRPMGLERLSSVIKEKIETIKWVIEPFLFTVINIDDRIDSLVDVDRLGRKATGLAGYYINKCKTAQRELGLFPNEIFPSWI